MKGVLVGLSLVFGGSALAQIPDFGGKQKAEKMEKLSYIVGEWEGTGWAVREGRRSEFKCYELVEKKAGGTVLAVTGRHWIEIPNREPLVVHDAFGMIYYEAQGKAFKIIAHLATGMANEFVINEEEMGYKWTTPAPGGGTYEYEASFTADTWVEKGFETVEGKRVQWFEMSLKRKK